MASKIKIFFTGATGKLRYPELRNVELLTESETQDMLGVLSSRGYLIIPRGTHSK
jgi:hypothetical protein